MGNSSTTMNVMRGEEEFNLADALETHPTMKQYRVECALIPGSGRMTRTYKLRHRHNESVAVVKVMMVEKDGPDLTRHKSELEAIRRSCASSQQKRQSHVAPFLAWFVGGEQATARLAPTKQLRPVFLMRPHMYTTLSDRLASRPWLAPVEKLWIVHQLLLALRDLHGSGVVHGSLTTENVGLTSYNYVVLTDLSSCYRPHQLADDDPSEYLHYFQLQQTHHHHGDDDRVAKRSEKRCYLAPERFYAPSSKKVEDEDNPSTVSSPSLSGGDNEVDVDEAGDDSSIFTPAVDIFSTGCVLVELLLGGERCLDLGDLIEYRRTKTMPATVQQKLAKIESSHLRAACRNMLSLDPAQRLSAGEYWDRLDAADQIPTSSFEFLTNLIERVTTEVLSPDARIAIAAANYDRVLWETMGEHDRQGQDYFDKVLGREMLAVERPASINGGDGSERLKALDQGQGDPVLPPTAEPATAPSSADDLFAETDALLKQLEDFDLNSNADAVGSGSLSEPEPVVGKESEEQEKVDRTALCKSSLLIFLQLLLATIRHAQRPTSKLVALQLIRRLARYSSDEARLQRIVPVAVALLQDQDPLVRAAVTRTLTYTLSIVESFSPFDSQVFPQYIFKRVGHLISDPSLVVRITFAKCLAVLAETAQRFLDIRHAVRLYEAVESGTGATTPNTEDQGTSIGEKGGNIFTDDLTKLLDNTTDVSSSETGKASDKLGIADRTGPACGENALVAAGKTLINSTYNSELAGLRETLSRWVVQIVTDQSDHSALPKRSLLGDLGRLCQFFGTEVAMSFVLPQIVALLNDRKNWELRAALFDALPSVCHIIGRAATEEFVLPCVEIGLVDVEEYVIARALSCLTSLIAMNLLSRAVLLGGGALSSSASATGSGGSRLQQQQGPAGSLKPYSILLIHPSEDICHEAIKTFSTVCNVVGSPAARAVYFLPVIRPMLRYEPPNVSKLCSERDLRLCIKKPWTREQFLDELNRCSVHGEAAATDGTWTSIGIQVREDTEAVETTASSPVRKAAVSLEHGNKNEEQEDPVLSQMHEYLRMLVRHTYQSPPTQELRHNSSSILSTRSEILSGIEGSVKLAQSIMFPRQDTRVGAGQKKTDSLPSWYSTLRDTAEVQNSAVTEASAIQSVSALGHVYGLSIMGPPAEGTTAENIVGIAADDSQRGDIAAEDEEAINKLRDPNSKILEASYIGQWGSETMVDPDAVDTSLLVAKLQALNVPTLPPNFGDKEPPHNVPMSTAVPPRGAPTSEWKPRINAFVASSIVAHGQGHTAPVVRLAVSGDNSFFVSGSHDGTCRVWDIPKVEESVGVLENSLVYTGHSENNCLRQTRVNDLAMIENSHSVVSGSSDGSVHIWRVDMIASSPGTKAVPQNDQGRRHDKSSKVVGTSDIRRVNPEEGEILAVSHFNTLSSSVVIFGTQKGCVHSWDLRCSREPFMLRHGPELGHLTSVVLGNDRQWIVTGTSRGYVALWDLRFHQAVKLWQHSRRAPISRLATSVVTPPQSLGSRTSSEGVRPFIFAACGDNECAMFDAVTGSCRECFRTITGDRRELNARIENLPSLDDVPMSTSAHRGGNTLSLLHTPQASFNYTPPVGSINCMVGSIGAQNHCFLITGGSDHRIRFWDFSTPSKCYIASGLSQTQLRPSFERIDFDSHKTLMLCRQPRIPLRDSNKLFHGLHTPELQHTDAIQDLKIIDNSALVSCSRDCTVKVWR